MSAETDPLEGLPPDLARLLRDPRIITAADQSVFEMIAEWSNAPSDTPSAMTTEDWQGAWSFMVKQWQAASAALDQARAENDRLMETVCVLAGRLGLFGDEPDPLDDAQPVPVPPELRERVLAEVRRRVAGGPNPK